MMPMAASGHERRVRPGSAVNPCPVFPEKQYELAPLDVLPENTPYTMVVSNTMVVSILGARHAPRRQEVYLVRGRAAHHFLHIAEIVKLVEECARPPCRRHPE
jgi:hypothetical protein